MEIKERDVFDGLAELTPTQLQEKVQNDKLVISCNFTEQEQTKINEIAKNIDIADRIGLIPYGSGAQDKLTKFTTERLSKHDMSNLSAAEEALNNVIANLKTFNPGLTKNPPKNFLVRLFKQKKQDIAENLELAKGQLTSVSDKLDKVEKVLIDEHYKPLCAGAVNLKEMHSIVEDIYRELSMYMAAGLKSLDFAKTVELPELDRRARESKDKLDANMLLNFSKSINFFEGNIYCLESSREMCLTILSYIDQLQDKYIDTANQVSQVVKQAIPQWQMYMNLDSLAKNVLSAQQILDEVRSFNSTLAITIAEEVRDLVVKTTANANKPVTPIETAQKVNDIFIGALEQELGAYRQNMEEMREGRRVLRKMEESRNEALRNYAIESAKIAIENAHINENPNVQFDEPIEGIHEVTREEPRKYTL